MPHFLPSELVVIDRVLLRVLWFGWLVLLLASFLAGRTRQWWWNDAKLDLRMISCLLLAVAAWGAWWAFRRTPAALAIYKDVTGLRSVMWGPSIIGFGSHHASRCLQGSARERRP